MNDDEWNMNRMKIIRIRTLNKLTDYSRIGRRNYYILREDIRDEEEDVEEEFYVLRRKLIDHYYYLHQYRPQALEWLN